EISASKRSRTNVRNSAPTCGAIESNEEHKLRASPHVQSRPTAAPPASEWNDGISVTTGGNPPASASLSEQPLPSRWLPSTNRSDACINRWISLGGAGPSRCTLPRNLGSDLIWLCTSASSGAVTKQHHKCSPGNCSTA